MLRPRKSRDQRASVPMIRERNMRMATLVWVARH